MTAADPRVIRNRFKRSPLPRNWDIAEALRTGQTTLDELATLHGVKAKSITKRLWIGGWDADGHPVPPWRLDELPAGHHICTRCGRERERRKTNTSDLCFDCKQVEADLARIEKETAA